MVTNYEAGTSRHVSHVSRCKSHHLPAVTCRAAVLNHQFVVEQRQVVVDVFHTPTRDCSDFAPTTHDSLFHSEIQTHTDRDTDTQTDRHIHIHREKHRYTETADDLISASIAKHIP